MSNTWRVKFVSDHEGRASGTNTTLHYYIFSGSHNQEVTTEAKKLFLPQVSISHWPPSYMARFIQVPSLDKPITGSEEIRVCPEEGPGLALASPDIWLATSGATLISLSTTCKMKGGILGQNNCWQVGLLLNVYCVPLHVAHFWKHSVFSMSERLSMEALH